MNLGIHILFEGRNFLRLLLGLLVTLEISFISILISFILGLFVGFFATTKSKVFKLFFRVYLESIRIIPVLVWLFIFYFGVTKAFHIHLDAKIVTIIVFSLWGTAEMGDLVRGAVLSLPKHQWESAKALGLTKIQIYIYVIAPQIIKRLLPVSINLCTRMIKTTSIVVLIGVVEVLKVGQQIIEASILKEPTAAFWIYGFIFFMYFLICYPVSRLSKKLEKRWSTQ